MWGGGRKSLLSEFQVKFLEVEYRARNKDFTLIGHFVFPWLRRFGKFPIYIHVLYVPAKGDLIGHLLLEK